MKITSFVYNPTRVLIVIAAIGLLSACASTPQKMLARGERNYYAQNYKMSYSQVKKAAESGDADAQYALGYMYYYGKGTPQDIELGKAWIHKAAAQGQPMAIKALKLMGEAPSYASATTTKSPYARAGSSRSGAGPVKSDFGKTAAATQAPATTTRQSYPQRTQTVAAKQAATPAATYEGQGSAMVAAKPASSNPSSKKQLLAMPNNYYTLQLMAVRNPNEIGKFARQNHLQGKVYSYYDRAKGLYIMLYGSYPSFQAAKNAVSQLPSAARQLKPWIRPMSNVKSEATRSVG